MKSARYFENSRMTRKALAAYARFANGRGEKAWSIAQSKLKLYRDALIAFAGTANDGTKRASHEKIFGQLRSSWGLGRNGTELWQAAIVFDVLTNHCHPCSRSSRLTLATLEDEPDQKVVLGCLKSMRGLKKLRSGNYPVMAVSKNLHFFNPRLFVIYDNDVILGRVYRVFKEDWIACYRRFRPTADEWLNFYVAYLLWASHMVRKSHERLMEDFADWFIQTVSDEADAQDFRNELRLSYATAFEFIVIGAAQLESTCVPRPCTWIYKKSRKK